ncbi:MAG: hypothetical protein KJ578_07075 [Bacteroidetes bacterium]|nr:hypothetical protein [Bacteroidota bacterium]MBU1580194.1 hypothetical protein [Bacteroidota bacterium]MBU2466628.1 hypothetical protein [Bacteroidota bacterium]MBU2557523.1 hypothetical protein [Bacteroidota bacterium]
MKKHRILLLIVLLLAATVPKAQTAYGDQKLNLNGYLKTLPSVSRSFDDQSTGWNNIVHNRLNLNWMPNNNWYFEAAFRNRIFWGDNVSNTPDYLEMLEADGGFLDLTLARRISPNAAFQLSSDRFFVEWRHSNWQISLGRQRINWGINLVSNPNDLFNTYSFFDFDYVERPGADALRVQHHLSGMSRLELAVAPADHISNAVAALYYVVNVKGYDLQVLGGYFHNRLALGGGWAGNLSGAGFKGEVSWFSDLQKTDSLQSSNMVAAVSVDYLFAGGLYGVFEVLYNGGYNRQPAMLVNLNQPLRADNLSLAEFALTASLSYPLSPILTANVSAMAMPDQQLYYALPGISWSLVTNLDLGILLQTFVSGDQERWGKGGMAGFVDLKWSF